MAEQNITDILRALTRIETDVKTIAKNSADHEQRLRTLEQRGGKRWDALTLSVITAVAVGVVGFVLGKWF